MSVQETAMDAVESAIGERPARLTPLAGGCIAEVWRAEMPGGDTLAVKHDAGPNPRLDIEGKMLALLRERTALPVPEVVASTPRVLAMAFVENSGRASGEGERAFGALLARTHLDATSDRFGLGFDTLIGPLDQPNPPTASWAAFWRDARLLPMAEGAHAAGGIDGRTLDRVRRLCDQIERFVDGDGPPALLHGDLWSGNVLWRGGELAAVIDPAAYFGHPDAELAFIDWMGGVSRAFWEGYHETRPIDGGFWEVRTHVHVLYPVLVHARLFGGGYGRSADAALDRLGVG
ncbi:MAG: fructosamine kinase family protein [Phycisphaerales bacterium]